MKTFIAVLLSINVLVNAQAADSVDGIAAMQAALENQSLEAFFQTTKERGWSAPPIPSQWHVEHVSKPEQGLVDQAARAFGYRLAARISETTPEQLFRGVTGDALYQKTLLIFDLADWCAAPEGYGNLFLAQPCLEFASVGLAMLTSDLTFPLEKCTQLVQRLNASWLSADVRSRVLNNDAGAAIFHATQQQDLERVWGEGGVLMRDQRNPSRKPEREKKGWYIPEPPAVMANLAFFEEESSKRDDRGQITLLSTWDQKRHVRIVNGLEVQPFWETVALVRFRERIGRFPMEDDPRSSHRGPEGAFSEAWADTVKKLPGMSREAWNHELHEGLRAWNAYARAQSIQAAAP